MSYISGLELPHIARGCPNGQCGPMHKHFEGIIIVIIIVIIIQHWERDQGLFCRGVAVRSRAEEHLVFLSSECLLAGISAPWGLKPAKPAGTRVWTVGVLGMMLGTDCVSVYNTTMFILLFLAWINSLLMIFNKNQTSPYRQLNKNCAIHFKNSAEIIFCYGIQRVGVGRQPSESCAIWSLGFKVVQVDLWWVTIEDGIMEWGCGIRAFAE